MGVHVGDWIVVEPVHLGAHRRRGEVVRLAHPDGSPPYYVRWEGEDKETLFFPGSEAHLENPQEHGALHY
ncbi:DUF1918 domain-containing protein [Allostreptomyces psammosilenae]|uniref:DUF1918 domain-containing protein n=1 Tax=Allostreptomyces psammosilenae TaxID=1892865 RepID=A0A852ZQ70_9ACTN|nr:DUF1918 domain-containing protein [Allostreptomyces psammosilenae]NYI04519.1 hypothetical protein [Allostreptomyces psammosilenae]